MGQHIRNAAGLVRFAVSLLQSTKSQVRPAEPDAGKADGRGPRSCRQSRMQDKEPAACRSADTCFLRSAARQPARDRGQVLVSQRCIYC